MMRKILAASTFALALCGLCTPASAGLIVQGTSSIWLGGQASGASVSGFFGTDTIPGNAPAKFLVTGSTVSLSATGSTSVDGSCFAGASGGCYSDQSGFSPTPWDSLYNGPADALIGIFLSSTAPTLGTVGGYQGPQGWVSGPDYQNPLNVGPGTYSPALGQIFLIGDGSGETFNVPAGAAFLYLAVADSIGGSTGNSGSLSVSVTGATAVPEPLSISLFGVGLAAAFGMRRRKKQD